MREDFVKKATAEQQAMIAACSRGDFSLVVEFFMVDRPMDDRAARLAGQFAPGEWLQVGETRRAFFERVIRPRLTSGLSSSEHPR